jgi:antitoxin HicB
MNEGTGTRGYRFEVYQIPDDESWAAVVPELPGCVGGGRTPEEAVEACQGAMEAWIEAADEDGRPVPAPPPPPGNEYSGRFLLRLPKGLHARVAEQARREGVSLNFLCATMVAEALGERPRPAAAAPQARNFVYWSEARAANTRMFREPGKSTQANFGHTVFAKADLRGSVQ